MAKSTHSQEALTGTPDSYTEEEATDPYAPAVIRRAMLGEVDNPSLSKVEDGTDSSQFSENESKSSESETADPRKPVQTTESPSSETEAESSDADSTDGPIQEAETPQSAKRPAKKAASKKANTRTLNEFDDFE